MCRGEYEALKAIHLVSGSSVPIPHGIGSFDVDPSKHFLLTEFREIARQVSIYFRYRWRVLNIQSILASNLRKTSEDP